MAEDTLIEWTRHTFNPWSGCEKVSKGCAFCYADAAPPSWRRFAEWGKGKPRIPASESYWKMPEPVSCTVAEYPGNRQGLWTLPAPVERRVRELLPRAA